MNNVVVEEWKHIKQNLLDNIDITIYRNNVDKDILLVMKEMLLHSEIKYNEDKPLIDGKY